MTMAQLYEWFINLTFLQVTCGISFGSGAVAGGFVMFLLAYQLRKRSLKSHKVEIDKLIKERKD